ncbi:hypothetical protein ARMGADRAFT_56700 [Armillaria gallica]|uniref:Uncharacterized protein n=1 Tax=Armillaria gallica TaxID=47427 RepID=A0A2H3EZ33_ARMGA|nr:hypothetical protein ARMGADRAFT_56700 [Armillaria gallica]
MQESPVSQTRQTGISSTLDSVIDALGLQAGVSLIPSTMKMGGNEVLVIQGTHGTYDRLDALFGEAIAPKMLAFAFYS